MDPLLQGDISLKHFKPTPGSSAEDGFIEAVRYIRSMQHTNPKTKIAEPKAPPKLASIGAPLISMRPQWLRSKATPDFIVLTEPTVKFKNCYSDTGVVVACAT